MKLPKLPKRQPPKTASSTSVLGANDLGGEQSLMQLRESVNIDQLRQELEINNGQADLRGKRAYYKLRTIWGYLTIGLLAISLLFTYWLVKGVGTGALDFTGYETFLNIVAGTLIVDVLGLVAIVMHFLFPGEPKDK